MRPWLALPVVLALGLGVRAFTGGDFAKYAGVALYTTLIYAFLSFWLRPLHAALTATAISWAVEFFQLTGIPADLSAHSTLAHLVLGSTFNTPDLFWYAAGAALGTLVVRSPERPPAQRWSWEYPVPPRWVVLGDVGFDGGYEIDVPLALCTGVEGVFVDLPARPREQFTLVGCTPSGALADLANRLPGEQAWLGNIYVAASPPPPNTAPSWSGEDLADLVVLAQRPSLTLPGALDIDLDGFVHVDDRTDAVVRPNDVTEFFLFSPDKVPLGTCQDITGLFRDEAESPVPQVRLLGCQPEPPMLAALAAVGDSSDAGLHRRRIQAGST